MKLLIIGDVVSTPGRTILKENLDNIIAENAIDFTIVNGENASGGRGISYPNAEELFALPIDVMTMGNHVWNQKKTETFIDQFPNMIRPLNYPEPCAGKGYTIKTAKNGKRIAVLNLSGDIFMPTLLPPFQEIEKTLNAIEGQYDLLVVDFHAEATSEKIAMGYYLDGKATAVVGTHTHVQTADNRILPKGTAYITDLGMTGPLNGVIGMKKEIILHNMLTKRPKRFEVEKAHPWQLNGAIVTVDEVLNIPTKIERLYTIYER